MLSDMTARNIAGNSVSTSIFIGRGYMLSRVCKKKARFKLGSVKSKPQDLKKSSAELIAIIS